VELGIDFGGTAVKLGLFDDGVLLGTDEVPTTGTPADLDAALDRAVALADRAGVRADAVGIAVPGVVDAARRTMVQANDKYDFLKGFDVVRWAEDAFGVPAVLENDARSALVGEVRGGSADGARDAVLVTLGTGIGTAAMMDGVLVRGAHGHAGILGGHVTIDLDGPPCPCGNIGCAEMLASTRALREGHPGIDGIREVVAGAAASAELALLLDRYIAVWGATVVGMCHMYDPDVVVLSGGVMRAGDAVRSPLEEYVAAHLWSSAHRPRVVVPGSPELSAVRGLAALARDERRIDDKERA
jgi:glucokinase